MRIPQTWLDERLFGWSSNASRGTSAWGGHASQLPSGVTSPDASDGEDGGDYEHVFGLLPSDGDGSPARVRSRSLRSSYADLQQLKITPAITSGTKVGNGVEHSPTDDGDGLHWRHGTHRERKSSLNDRVSVKRLSAIERDESFKEATEEINEENTIRKHED